MRTIDLRSIRTIPVLIENEAHKNVVWLGFEKFRTFMVRLGLGDVTLDLHTDVDKFESARNTHGYGVVGVERWDHLNRYIGDSPVINEWSDNHLVGMHWGTTNDTLYTNVVNDLTSFLKTHNFVSNIVCYRHRDVTLPEVDGVTVYNRDITPNTLLQRGIGIFDAVDSPVPVYQTPYSSFRHNLFLELDRDSYNYRRMTASLHRDTYTWINHDLGCHLTTPTVLGLERAFGSLLFQTGVLPTWWR